LVLFVLLGCALRVESARADESVPLPPASGLDATLEQQVRSLALGGASGVPTAGVSRVEVVVGQLDQRLRLAPCQRVEPYLPPNARLWGKSRIGLRCAQGTSNWNVYLPITIKAYGRALVATIISSAQHRAVFHAFVLGAARTMFSSGSAQLA